MKNMLPILDRVDFEIRYGSGHLYFDRCGQCLVDIERECLGWTPISADVQSGRLENPSKSLYAGFNPQRFNFTAEKASKLTMSEIAKETSCLWKIIQANLALDELVRMGFRLNYLLATESIDEAAKHLDRCKINLVIPESLLNDGYSIKTRHLIVILDKDDTEYRVELTAITRYEGLAPPDFLRTDPRLLSKGQKEFRIAKLKQMAEYSANPMFAVDLNVDCSRLNTETLSVEEFILKQAEVTEKTFLPFLGEL